MVKGLWDLGNHLQETGGGIVGWFVEPDLGFAHAVALGDQASKDVVSMHAVWGRAHHLQAWDAGIYQSTCPVPSKGVPSHAIA